MGEFRRDHSTGRFNRRDSPRDSGRGRGGSSFGSRDSSSSRGGERSEGRSRFGGRSERREPQSFGKRTTNKQDLFKVICAKCGKECEVPFKPTNNKPVFCRECFKKPDGYQSREFEPKKEENTVNLDELNQRFDDLEERLDEMSGKLTRILNLLGINEK